MRVLLLDLDDTLFDRTAAFRRWAAQHLGARTPEELDWLAIIDDRGRRSRHALATAVIERYELTDSAAGFASRFPSQLAACVEPEPGVRDVVERVARRVRVAVVTNGSSDAQREKLRRAELDDLVHEVFVSEELGEAKPGHAIFKRALAWGGAPAAECMFVGDDPINDMAPAAALGMATAWRARAAWPSRLAPPTHVLDSLAALVPLVEAA